MPAYVVQDPVETYLHKRSDEGNVHVVVAKDSISLRTLDVKVGKIENVKAILDPGCQIIAMSDSICKSLGIPYDPDVRVNMESANGTVNESLGLACNIPITVAGIILFFQIHVIPEPAYDVLLGRPFDVLTESIVRNFQDTSQTITIHDPNTGQAVVVPTQPRKPR